MVGLSGLGLRHNLTLATSKVFLKPGVSASMNYVGSGPSNPGPLTFVRGKRTKKVGLLPGAQRIINMLSVMSARKKQPKRLKMVVEDIIRHEMVQKAWQIFMRNKKTARELQYQAQYNKMKEACDELEKLNSFLAFEATRREKGKRFSSEFRIPTETPPNEIWAENWKSTDPYQQRSF